LISLSSRLINHVHALYDPHEICWRKVNINLVNLLKLPKSTVWVKKWTKKSKVSQTIEITVWKSINFRYHVHKPGYFSIHHLIKGKSFSCPWDGTRIYLFSFIFFLSTKVIICLRDRHLTSHFFTKTHVYYIFR